MREELLDFVDGKIFVAESSDSDSTYFLLSPREVEPDSAMGDFIKKKIFDPQVYAWLNVAEAK